MEKLKPVTNKKKKRTQRDYSLGFKLIIVNLVEKGEKTYKQAQRLYGIQGRSTVLVWLRKYGNLDWNKPRLPSMKNLITKETPSQKIKRLEKSLEDERLKNMVLNEMINISDSQYGTSIRKKFSTKQSENFKKRIK